MDFSQLRCFDNRLFENRLVKIEDHLAVVEQYSKTCGFFRDDSQDIKYTSSLSLDMGDVEACLSGPKRPQDRVLLSDVKDVSEREIKKLKKSPSSDGVINDGRHSLLLL